MRIAHLTASPFFGGPERQILGLALNLPAHIRSFVISFPERGLCRPFLDELKRHGVAGHALAHNVPHVPACVRELTDLLRARRIDVLCCHGYKPDVLGWFAARKLGIPVVAVSRGWTAATWKVRVYEAIDRLSLRRMDRVVGVSDGQAAKVCRAGVAPARVRVIRNAIDTERFGEPSEASRGYLQSFFGSNRSHLIGAAGRLSPEKGFDVLIAAAALVVRARPDVGFVLFGEGPLRASLARQIDRLGLCEHFALADFVANLDRWMPNFDLFALPSHTEGLPNVVLEAFAARVPVVATAVGGTPEVVESGRNGFLVPPGEVQPLADRLIEMLADDRRRGVMGMAGYYRVRDDFTFDAQARQYAALFEEVAGAPAYAIPERAMQAATSAPK